MAFTDNIKEITPAITLLKSNTPVIVIDGKIYVAGIGGNFIPGSAAASLSGTANIAAGYITISDSVITVHNVTDGTISTTDKLYIADTGVEEPEYLSGGGGATSMDFYKCATVDSTNHTWAGYLLSPNADNGYSLASMASLVGEYYIQPAVGGIYDQTCKIKLMSYYEGDNVDPYGDGLLYRIFVNGGSAWTDSSYGADTTDNYTANVETANGITARKFNGSERVTATVPNTRTIWSYSVWVKRINVGYAIGCKNIGMFGIYLNDYEKFELKYGNGTNEIAYDIVPQAWNHIIVTYNGGSFAVYLNGSSIWTGNNNIGSQSGFVFGALGASDGDYYNGYIANFRFYDHVLTSSEIATLYAELTPTSN